ncbi:MAG TPA: homoserine kinase [Methylophaga aminisulfidivorans]|uniref:Homoserine kinase n=2 Tax=root TaxID=1 RepID=A0A7C1W6J9_9GAMM|nr:homoserine kinase [Methylophaga aminisulfidivorans]HEC74976.1 homoserine kinase [Methylophaga aminisulfidivorans]
MSVYTEVERDDLIAFLGDYSVGELVSYQGISDGIENTNYFVTTSEGQFVLTLFEHHDFDELGYFLDVMTFFYQQGIPSAHPEADQQGQYLKQLCGKPAALVVRLPGRGVSSTATLAQCAQIGEAMADMHIAGQQFKARRDNERGPVWRQQTAETIYPKLDTEQSALLRNELAYQQGYAGLDLPAGVTHADLFRDNALFDGENLTGIIDFYFASDEYLAFDLAVAVNDWCINDEGLPDPQRYQALMQRYTQKRPLTEAEKANWNMVCRAAALRFWLSRLQDKLFPREGELTQIKNPDAFLHILKHHRQHPLSLDFN